MHRNFNSGYFSEIFNTINGMPHVGCKCLSSLTKRKATSPLGPARRQDW